MKPKALIIDLDDTLIDSTASADRVWRTTAEAFAPELGLTVEAIDRALMAVREWYWSCPERNQRGRLDLDQARFDVVHRGFQKLGIDDPGLSERFAAAYTAERIHAIRPFPGALDAVKKLRQMGMRLALITNGQAGTQRRKVDGFDLEAHFDSVLIEGELGFGKPNRRVYERALEDLGQPAAATWMVGDNLYWEVAVPQSLGMTGIWVDWKKAGLPPASDVRPDRVIHSVAELPGLVQKALSGGVV